MEYHHQLKDVILQMNTLKITPKYILNDNDYEININHESFENIIIGYLSLTAKKFYYLVPNQVVTLFNRLKSLELCLMVKKS